MFNEKDLLLIRFESKLKNKDIDFKSNLTNDWKVDFVGYSEVSICSANLNVRLNIKTTHFIELMNAGVLRNGVLEGNYRPLKYLGEFYLLKENSNVYNVALKNSDSKKLVLKTGSIYDIFLKTHKVYNVKTRNTLNIPNDNKLTKCVFLGTAILATGGNFSLILRVRTNTDTVYLFKINKEIYWIKKREVFDIIKQHCIDPAFTDKAESIRNLNEILLDRFKTVFEKNKASNFEVLFSSNKDFKNSVENNNDLFLEKSKLIVKKYLDEKNSIENIDSVKNK